MNISTNDLVNLLATSNYIVYNQVIAKKLGVDEAILLGVLCSYQKHFNGQEFYREEDKLAEDTALSIYAIRKAKQHLKDVGILEITKKGLPAQHYFKIHPEKIFEISTTSTDETTATSDNEISTASGNEMITTSGDEMITTSGDENITTSDNEMITTIYNNKYNIKNNTKYNTKEIYKEKKEKTKKFLNDINFNDYRKTKSNDNPTDIKNNTIPY